MYDITIIGGGAGGLFTSINLDKNLKKIILEKNPKAGIKVLLSGGERANVSNINIDIETDYFGQNKKVLKSIFSQYNQYDIINFFNENGIEIVEEDRGRLILKSGDSKELLKLLLDKSYKNNTILKNNFQVEKIKKIDNYYEIYGHNDIIKSKNVIISSGGKSFFQVGTTGDGYKIAKDLGIDIIPLHKGLTGISTKKNLSILSGTSINIDIYIKDDKKIIYKENGPLLFTHFGLSGPIIYNSSIAIGEYLNTLKISTENDKNEYLKNKINIYLDIKKENCTKKIYNFFKENIDKNQEIVLGIQDFRSWKEAKVTGGGININELDKFLQSKRYKGLFFIGEIIDITGKTGGYNLQWAWSSAYICSRFFLNK